MQFRFASTTLTVNMPTREALLDALRARLTTGQGFALATINLDHLVKLRQSASFRAAYAAHDLICADGNPIVWLSRLARKPVELLPGSDMVMPMVELAAECGRPIALVGSSDTTLQATAAEMTTLVPDLEIALLHAPAMGFDPQGPAARAILADLAAAKVGLCLIALGAPKQELFAALGRELAPNVGFASIGAGLDFIAGEQVRAPAWVRAMALEWLWRTFNSPRRMIPRYAACAALLPGQVVQALKQR